MVEIGLSECRKVPCDCYVFPADLFDVPGVETFDDVEKINAYALVRLSELKDKCWCVYINSGLSIMFLSVILAATKLGATVMVKHYDIKQDVYIERPVYWKSSSKVDDMAVDCLTLCASRHYGLPETVIFEQIPEDKIMDFSWQEQVADTVLRTYAGKHIKLYITGMTQALVSVLNITEEHHISITCMHYDYASESYFPQRM